MRKSENLLLGNGRHELLQVERLEICHVLELLIRQQLASRNQHLLGLRASLDETGIGIIDHFSAFAGAVADEEHRTLG